MLHSERGSCLLNFTAHTTDRKLQETLGDRKVHSRVLGWLCHWSGTQLRLENEKVRITVAPGHSMVDEGCPRCGHLGFLQQTDVW